MTKGESEMMMKNIYVMDVVPKVIQFIEKETSPSADMTELSDEIRSIRNSAMFEKKGKKYNVRIDYSRINLTASRIARNYDTQWKDIANILLSPFFPQAEFTENDLTLLETLEDEFREAPFTHSQMEKMIRHSFDSEKEMNESYAHLLEKGIITVEVNKSTLVCTIPSPYDDKREDVPLEIDWYIDDKHSLHPGRNPNRNTLADLVAAFMEAEKDYQREWWAPIEKENERLMEIFEKDLEGLKAQSRDNYISDINYFLDSYFYYETVKSIHDASVDIIDFFRYFICKCPGHSEYIIKRMMSTIKRFYNVMLKNGEVTEEECERVLTMINDNKEWLIEAETDYDKRIEYFCLW